VQGSALQDTVPRELVSPARLCSTASQVQYTLQHKKPRNNVLSRLPYFLTGYRFKVLFCKNLKFLNGWGAKRCEKETPECPTNEELPVINFKK
jgi:hypothetical protein